MKIFYIRYRPYGENANPRYSNYEAIQYDGFNVEEIKNWVDSGNLEFSKDMYWKENASCDISNLEVGSWVVRQNLYLRFICLDDESFNEYYDRIENYESRDKSLDFTGGCWGCWDMSNRHPNGLWKENINTNK